ncbi:MAG: hypothetical protein GY928_21360 [Colwellia sp.]|nr:hypothetical protein [Colwellia sp.]
METIELLKKIPFMLKAKEADQWSDVFSALYDLDGKDKISSVARGKNRFYLIDRMQIPFYMWRKKRHLKDILQFMDKNHKVHKLSKPEQVKHSRSATKIEKKQYSDIDNVVMYSRW